jgi:adenylate cyclase 1
MGVVYVIMLILDVVIKGRKMEWKDRMELLWKIKDNEEKSEMDDMKKSKKRIMLKMMKENVEKNFMEKKFRSKMKNL